MKTLKLHRTAGDVQLHDFTYIIYIICCVQFQRINFKQLFKFQTTHTHNNIDSFFLITSFFVRKYNHFIDIYNSTKLHSLKITSFIYARI